MYPLFALFELPFLLMLLLFGGLGIFVTASVEKERFGGATFGTILVIGLLHMSGLVNVIALFANPLYLVISILAYIAIGMFWGVGKWRSYLGKRRREILDAVEACRASYFKEVERQIDYAKRAVEKDDSDKNRKSLEDAIAQNSEASFQSAVKEKYGKQLPTVKESLGRVTGWSIYWVPSVIWFVIDEPVRRIFTTVIRAIGGWLEAIRSREQAKLDKAFNANL